MTINRRYYAGRYVKKIKAPVIFECNGDLTTPGIIADNWCKQNEIPYGDYAIRYDTVYFVDDRFALSFYLTFNGTWLRRLDEFR